MTLACHAVGVHSCVMSPQKSGQDVFLDIFDGAPTRNLNAGDRLINAGETADHVFNILDGMLMVSRTGGDGRRQVLSFLVRDNFVGLTATDHYFFTVEAVMPTRVVCRPRHILTRRLANDPDSERTFMNMLFRVLEDAFDLIYSLGQRTAVERLAVFVLYLRHWHRLSDGVDDLDPVLNEVHLPMSREDIADFLGLKKETVSRSFRQLEERGLVDRADSHRVHILDLVALRKMAGIRDFSSPRRLVDRSQ
jgi:CRP/FNR family transcriptional regulator